METLLETPQKTQVQNVTLKQDGLTLKYLQNINLIVASGPSDTLNVLAIYFQLIDMVELHFDHSPKLNCYFQYSSVNGTTVKLLFNLFRTLQKAYNRNKAISVNWIIMDNNEEVAYVGLEFKKFFDFEINIVHS